jgi:hypothetical protein
MKDLREGRLESKNRKFVSVVGKAAACKRAACKAASTIHNKAVGKRGAVRTVI